MIELNLGLEKSGNFILSGKWQPGVKAHHSKRKLSITDRIPWRSVLLQKSSEMSIILGYLVIKIHCLFMELAASVSGAFYLSGKVLTLQRNNNFFPWTNVEYTSEGKFLLNNSILSFPESLLYILLTQPL